MFYIRRRCQLNYELVDMTTGRVFDVTRSQIAVYVNDGFTVLGVEEDGRFLPYQLPETLTSLQIKTHMMKNVDVRCYKKSITCVQFDSEKISTPVEIRLSDFGERVEDFIFDGNRTAYEPKLTLVLDDNIKSVGSKAFHCSAGVPYLGPEGLGVILDLRAVTSLRLAEACYGNLVGYCGDPFSGVVDHYGRKCQMRERFDMPEVDSCYI